MYIQRTGKDGLPLKTLNGYIVTCPSDRQNEDDSENEEEEQALQVQEAQKEEDEEDWLDYSQMKDAFNTGMFVKARKKQGNCKVVLMDYNNKRHSCMGFFFLTDPWWDVAVQINPSSKAQQHHQIFGYPQYALRNDNKGFTDHNLVSVLIGNAFEQAMKSKREPQYREAVDEIKDRFQEFVKKEHLKDKLKFEHLETILDKFSVIEPRTYNAQKGDLIQTVLRAYKYPSLFQFICRLLPRKFLSCLLACPQYKLPELEVASQLEPWVFGFSKILTQRFSVYGMEATVRVYEMSGIIDGIPLVQKVSLYIYDVMKLDAQMNGHTYMSVRQLSEKTEKRLPFGPSDFDAALTFLSNNMVIVKENFDGLPNFFLYHNWKAEVDIANGMREVIQRGINRNKTAWDVDFTSPNLGHLKKDGAQWDAVQKVVAFPVTVLAGKGGCGKTTVVTSLITHVCLKDSIPSASTIEKQDYGPSDKLIKDNVADVDEIEECAATAQKRNEGAPKSSRLSAPQPVTPEQLSKFVATVESVLEEEQRQGGGDKRMTLDKIKVELTTDLVKYLATSGDTVLSMTEKGRQILLTAPTGKAARLLGHKAKMESCTLHRVIYSFRTHVKKRLQMQREKERMAQEHECHEEANDEDKSDWLDTWGQGAGSKTRLATSQQGQDEVPKVRKMENKSTDPELVEDQGDWLDTWGEGAGNKPRLATSKQGQDEVPKVRKMENESTDPEDEKWKYADIEVLVVDECSLVSIRLFATLLNILLENTNLWKIILLGDYRQLPSIEPGNFLEDVFKTFASNKNLWSLELKTNHRSESELIVSNATRISERRMPFFSPAQNFHFVQLKDFQEVGDPERDEAVRFLLKNRPEMHSHLPSQFVSFRNNDCAAINELCCLHYNNHSTHLSAPKHRKPHFAVGDKVCLTKNGQILNHALHLRHLLEPFPHILDAFGIGRQAEGRLMKEVERKLDLNATIVKVLRPDAAEQAVELSRGGNEKIDEGFEDFDIIEDELGLLDAYLEPDKNKPGLGNYTVQGTDFGNWTMAHAGGSSCNRSTPTASSGGHSAQLPRLADIGPAGGVDKQPVDDGEGARGTVSGMVEKAGGGRLGSTKSHQLPCSQLTKNDEEARAGKLKSSDVRLCNGEIFYIMDDFEIEAEVPTRFLTLSDRDPECPRVVCCSYRALLRECRMRHAWARTIHTFQGSESDTVAYFVGQAPNQNWKHVYTAVTRGRRSIFIVGQSSQLQSAVKKKDIQRRSRLRHRLNDTLKALQTEALQRLMQKLMNEARAGVKNEATVHYHPGTSSPVPLSVSCLPESQGPASYMELDVFTTVSLQPSSSSACRPSACSAETGPTFPTMSPLSSASSSSSVLFSRTTATTVPGLYDDKQYLNNLDSFSDSDDSWVSSMSPVWENTPRLRKANTVTECSLSFGNDKVATSDNTPVVKLESGAQWSGIRCSKEVEFSCTPTRSTISEVDNGSGGKQRGTVQVGMESEIPEEHSRMKQESLDALTLCNADLKNMGRGRNLNKSPNIGCMAQQQRRMEVADCLAFLEDANNMENKEGDPELTRTRDTVLNAPGSSPTPAAEQKVTTPKRHTRVPSDHDSATSKRSRSADPVDSILSPVRRTLHI